MNRPLDVAYCYPAPYWGLPEVGWVKTLLLFFDKVSILLPSYMYGRHHLADPVLAEPLEDLGLLEVLDPETWIDDRMTKALADAIIGLLAKGVFDDLPKDVYFHELSQSRIGYGADIDLAKWVVLELQEKGLARPSEDHVSVPMHPVVRTTILVILAQIIRSGGMERNLAIHPATSDSNAIRGLVETLSGERMPSRDNVISLDLEAVSFNLDPVPLDELLEFRTEHKTAHRAYMLSLRGFMAELSDTTNPEERNTSLQERRQEIAESAHELLRITSSAFNTKLRSFSLGLAGCAWSVTSGDVLGSMLAGLGLISEFLGLKSDDSNLVTAYSYLFQMERSFPQR